MLLGTRINLSIGEVIANILRHIILTNLLRKQAPFNAFPVVTDWSTYLNGLQFKAPGFQV